MKNLLVMLMIVIVTKVSGQVYSLQYTKFQLYDQTNHTYSQEVQVNVKAYVDMNDMGLYIISNGSTIVFRSTILSINSYDNTTAYKCQDHRTGTIFDIYITTTLQNKILKGKSQTESWVYKLPLN